MVRSRNSSGFCHEAFHRELNSSRETGGSYQSDGCESGGCEGACLIDDGRLNAALAIGTSGRFLRELVVTEQASEQSKNEDGNDGERLQWVGPAPGCPVLLP
jgi:hypothetical protein